MTKFPSEVGDIRSNRTCSTCKDLLPIGAFYPNRQTCKLCFAKGKQMNRIDRITRDNQLLLDGWKI